MKIRIGNKSGAAGRAAKGFTLVETIIAVGIFGIVVSALYSCFGLGFSIVRSAREDLQATQILLGRVERVRLCTWTQVTDPNVNPLTTTGYFDSTNKRTPCTLTYSAVPPPVGAIPSQYSDQVLLVTVQLTWTSGNNQQHTRSMQTYVARYGMNSYVTTGG
jgi:prepilin-type N-terminal cleavage/methylation domain-containing protein